MLSSFDMSVPDLSVLIQELAADDDKVAGSARRRLVARGNVAVASLVAALQATQNVSQYRGALRTLGEIAEAGALQDSATLRSLLIEHLKTHDGGERRSLITCLGHLGVDAAAESALLNLWKNEKRDDQLRVLATSLGRVGSAQSEPGLKSCPSTAPLVQREVARALSAIASRQLRTSAGEGRVAGDELVDGGVIVRLRCRSGLGELLLKTMPATLRDARQTAPGQIDAGLHGSLNSLFACRLWSEAVLYVPWKSGRSGPETFGAALAGDAGALLRKLTQGAATWRLHLPQASRGELFDYVRAAQQAAPELPNSPERAVWELRPTSAGLEILPRFWLDSRFKYLQATMPAMTHPPLAAALAVLSEPSADDIVWDPFCGVGTELAERAKAGPYKQLIGSDRDAAAVTASRANLQGVERIEFHIGDALKLQTPNVNVLLTNPPYGRKIQGGNIEKLLRELLASATRTMQGGRIVLCSPIPEKTWLWARELGWNPVKRLPVGTEEHALEAQLFVRD
ncbi:MAG: putative N6-adenine-specific methylase containing domain protein [Verrucomicrobiales bacterium]|nr:putative N6-adenine-specific methylase containing domain protein [Verrucomicrobiales bacterium]